VNRGDSFRLSGLAQSVSIRRDEPLANPNRAEGTFMPDLVLENVSQKLYDDLRRHGKARGAEEAEEGIAQPKEQMATCLQQWPAVSGAKALSANLAGFFRIRIGDYRLRFYVVGAQVIVDKIGHRRDFFDD
jgi:mRNA-degrading endonuclease RelE of RelBE toxin-antitoxin system